MSPEYFLDVKIYISDRMSLYCCRPLNPLIRCRLVFSSSFLFHDCTKRLWSGFYLSVLCLLTVSAAHRCGFSERSPGREVATCDAGGNLTCVLHSKETCVRVSEAASVDVRTIRSSPTSYLCLLSCSQWSYFMASRLCSHSHSSLAFSLEERNRTVSEASLGGAPQQRSTHRRLAWRLSIVLPWIVCAQKEKLLAVWASVHLRLSSLRLSMFSGLHLSAMIFFFFSLSVCFLPLFASAWRRKTLTG